MATTVATTVDTTVDTESILSKRMKLTKDHDVRSKKQNRFLLGHDVSGSISNDMSSPVKRRWSRLSLTRNSPTNAKFPQIRNRNYILALSPQHQHLRSRRSGSSTSRRVINFDIHQGASPLSLNMRHSRGKSDGDRGYGQKSGSKSSSDSGASFKTKGRKSRGIPKSSPVRSDTTKRKNSSSNDKASDGGSVVPSSTKWTPISEAAKSLLLDSVTYPSSLVGMSTTKRKIIEQQIAAVVDRVKTKLDTATAPRTRRLKSYSNLKQDIPSLRSEFLTLVNRNSEIEKEIQNNESKVKEQQEKAHIFSSHKGAITTKKNRSANLPNKDWTSESEGAFCDYLVDLIETTRYSLIQ